MTLHQRAANIDVRYSGGEGPTFYLVLLPDGKETILGVPHGKSPREVLKQETGQSFEECAMELIKNHKR